MKVRTAELAAVEGQNQDCVFVGSNAAVVLDGASGSDTTVGVTEYVEALGRRLIDTIESNPQVQLQDALHSALADTVADLGLTAGNSPSSTVGIARLRDTSLDVLVLGDTPVYVATASGVERITDERLANIPATNRHTALERLRSGSGFDDEHHRLLTAMRQEKTPRRNVAGGYWIAEAEPHAAFEAIVRSFPGNVQWCVLVTDGADDTMRHLGLPIEQLVDLDEPELAKLLAELHNWEEHEDPHGTRCPRFKRHDDKTIAAVTFP